MQQDCKIIRLVVLHDLGTDQKGIPHSPNKNLGTVCEVLVSKGKFTARSLKGTVTVWRPPCVCIYQAVRQSLCFTQSLLFIRHQTKPADARSRAKAFMS